MQKGCRETSNNKHWVCWTEKTYSQRGERNYCYHHSDWWFLQPCFLALFSVFVSSWIQTIHVFHFGYKRLDFETSVVAF